MNTGRSLQSLAAELERQTATRKDYIAPQSKLEAVVVPGVEVITGAAEPTRVPADVRIAGFNGEPMPLTGYAHGQLAAHLDIPKKYYDRMASEQPELLAKNINTWFRQDAGNARMLRTLDGRVRAVLSPKYRPLDNFDLAQTVLPELIKNEAQVVSAELTETRIYIKAILPKLSDELPAGLAWGTGHNAVGAGVDRGRVVSAIVISNSDVGNGALRVEPSVFTSWCTNLAIMAQAAMKKYHVGRANDILESSFEVFKDETRKADDRAFWLKVRDVMNVAFDEKMFRAAIDDMKRAGERPIKSDDLMAVVNRTVTELALPQATSTGVLKFLAAGGDLTQWGLSSAVTRVAGETTDYELATSLERAGGQILALPGRTWDAIATAA
jgi:hypothetical protein